MRLLCSAFLVIGGSLFAAETSNQIDRKSMIEMHQKMAQAHKKAADCLKANKPVDECNREAMKMCPMANSEMCPFMGGMSGMMNDHKKMKGEHKEMDMPENDKK